MNLINPYISFGDTTPLLFDVYSGETQAFSALSRKTGQGNVWRVYRKQDAVEQDFTAAQILAGAHTTFVVAGGGANHGLISAVYDIATGARHLYQAVENNMPTCVYSGTAVTINGIPALAFGTDAQSVNSQCWLEGAGLLNGGNHTVTNDYAFYAIFKPSEATSSSAGVLSQISGSVTYFNLSKGGGLGMSWAAYLRDLTGAFTGNNHISNLATTAAQLSVGLFDKTARTKVHYKNTTVQAGADNFLTSRGSATSRLTIGCGYDEFIATRYYFNGKIGDVFFYKTDMREADRVAISNLLITEYGIV